MSAMANRRRTFLTIAVLGISALISGCGGVEHGDERELVARINTYEMSVDDFESEAGLTAPTKYLSANPEEAKAELLDELITKKLLIQEAQKENFDKDRVFMKEIERYWEQALLKLLLKKKMRELSGAVGVDENEARKEYDRLAEEEGGRIGPYERMAPEIRDDLRNKKIREAFDGWIAGLKKRANITIYQENLKRIEMR